MAKAKGKAPAKGRAAAAAAPRETFIVGSKVKGALKAAGCNTSGDALDGLNGYVGWLVGQAAKRAAANGRKTVRPHDFILP